MGQWFKNQLGTVITLAVLLAATAAGYGALNARQDEIYRRLDAKADKDPIVRELDQIQTHLSQISRKIDELTASH